MGSNTHYTRFDLWVARQRHHAAIRHVRSRSRLCDLGCGVDALFLHAIRDRTVWSVGVDYQTVTARVPNSSLVRTDITSTLPFRDATFDHVTMLAVLEHLKDPNRVFCEAYRVLAPGGSLIITWPSGMIDPLLDVLLAVGIIAQETEIDQHQPRRPPAHWLAALKGIGFGKPFHRRFELGLNNLLVAEKPRA